ncbi:MAG: InlB B-repeat-containing protein, partial [Clostridia bacterium]|nr:InlB B-repeat-containing protein [Clostridia bacterium]
ESITAYAEIDEVDNENIETTEGVTADIVKTSDTAIISNVDISAIGEDEENIIFDLTKDANISAVSIAAAALQEAVTAEKGYGFKATDKNNKEVILVFDKDALSAISEDVTGNISVKIANPELEDTALDGDKQTELNGKSAKVYDLSLENANTTDFGEGTAIVALYYEKPAINGNVVAGYIKDDGTIETVPSEYDDTTKTIILALSHFSDYVIYTEPVIHHSSGGGGGGTTSYTVKFDTNGGDELKNISVQQGQAIGTIQTPQKKGFIFDGWYSDKELTKAYSADEKVTASTTLFAGWKIDPIRQMTLTIGDKNATVFGEETANDVAPIIRNDRTMLPIRFIAEALGAEVSWDGENKIVTITSDDTEIKITIDKGVAIVNGEEIVLDSPAFIESDRTFLPLRFVSENLGAEVDWVEETRQVVITKAIED